MEISPYTKVESNNKTFVGTLISDFSMIQSYNVTITLSYKVIAVNGNKAKIENISIYASYLKGAIQDGVDYPDIEIGNTTLAGDSLNLVDNDGDKIYSPSIVFDDEIIFLNQWVNFGDEITSLATIMLDSAIFPERHINIVTTIQKR